LVWGGIEDVNVHLIVRHASVGRILHETESPRHPVLEPFQIVEGGQPDCQIQVRALVKNLDPGAAELAEARHFQLERLRHRPESGHLPHCGNFAPGNGNGLRRPSEQALALQHQAVLFVDVFIFGRPAPIAFVVQVGIVRREERDLRIVGPRMVRIPELDYLGAVVVWGTHDLPL
jgi:hypothetical protein